MWKVLQQLELKDRRKAIVLRKRHFKILPIFLVMVTVLTSCAFKDAQIELSYDDQISEDGKYSTDMFYKNEADFNISDIQVIQITDEESTEYGYYYMYGTTGTTGFVAYRSKDFQNWESVSSKTGFIAFYPEPSSYCREWLWAPEVIYDENDDLYYMFYSGWNQFEEAATGANPLEIGLAVAEEPYGPFKAYEDATHNASTPLFDKEKFLAAMKPEDRTENITIIDPHPFQAPDGSKYLYFSRGSDPGGDNKQTLWAIQMNDWGDPNYSTLQRITRVGYLTVDGNEVADYEEGVPDNEGPYMYLREKEDGSYRYYLTFSIGDYNDKSYSVVQAVAEHPMGPFRKLTEEEGGIILSTDHMQMDNVSGPGHHSFIKVGNELVMAYHSHIDPNIGGANRSYAFDRVQIIKNAKGDEILYVNGPTTSLQPRFEEISGYKNIASDAEVTVSRGDNKEALTDGLLSIYSQIDFVKEYETEKTSTITLDFGEYREISGLMIYNSKVFEKAFPEISHIEFDFIADGMKEEQTAYIDDLQFDWNNNKNQNADQMRAGGSAIAMFAPMKVKTIRIELKLPTERPENIEILDEEGYVIEQKSIAISEIKVLGK